MIGPKQSFDSSLNGKIEAVEIEEEIAEGSFKDLLKKVDESNEILQMPEKQFVNEILDNPVNLELLPLTLQSAYEFQFLIESIKEMHPNYQILLDQFALMEPLLALLIQHFKVMFEVIIAGREKKLEDILSNQLYASIRSQYVLNVKDPIISAVILEESLKYIIKNLFLQIYQLLHKLNVPKPTLSFEDAAIDIQIIRSKLEAVVLYLPRIIQSHGGDLFTLPKSHSRWLALESHVTLKETAPLSVVKKEYDLIYRVVNIATATLHTRKKESGLLKGFMQISGPMYYWLFQEKADRIAKQTISNATSEHVLELWNLPETILVKNAWSIVYQQIATNIMINIPRVFPELTRENLQAEVDRDLLVKPDTTERPKGLEPAEESKISEVAASKMTQQERIPVRFLYHRNYSPEIAVKTSIQKVEIQRDIPMEESKNLEANTSSPNESKFSFFNQFSKWKENLENFVKGSNKDDLERKKELEEIVIHIHGGGFVSMSSGSHQNYTRRWANSLKRPIFSIDYRLAPENPFPASLDDCWQFYNWLLEFGNEVLGINPRKIVLAGDSAGGNLCIALTLKAINSGIRVPDGIFAIYPALSLDPSQFSPSLLNTMEDSILSYSFLKLCLSAYVPEGCDPCTNYYLSPVLAPNELLAKLPPIRVIVGEKDPLHDDSWRFLERMVALQKDIKMIVYRHLPHAFLSYDHTAGYKFVLEDCKMFIEELFAKADTQ